MDAKPLVNEVIFTGVTSGKNPSGAKSWTCKHYDNKFTSTYTRIHAQFLGPQLGKNSDIHRCIIFSSLKTYTLIRQQPSSTARPIQDAFKTMDRDMVDIKVMRGLCANAKSFNVLRNSQFHEMVTTINNEAEREIEKSVPHLELLKAAKTRFV
ncbi:hypothetical protein ACE6H2_015012 [Prunus campanulata]